MLILVSLVMDAVTGGLQDKVKIKTKELNAYVKLHGGGAACADKVPADSKATVAKMYDAITLTPDTGQTLEGSAGFVGAIMNALNLRRQAK